MSDYCQNRTCYQPAVPGRNYCQRCYISWRAKDRRRYETHTWPRQLQRKFGLTVREYWRLFTEQRGRCRICRVRPSGRKLSVDFHRPSGQVRGLLCEGCIRARPRKAAA